MPPDIRLLLLPLLLAGCAAKATPTDDGTTYTLVRSSPADALARKLGRGPVVDGEPPLRIHVATFDAKESPAYNAENCETAARLFQEQPGVTIRYWCEKGRFRE